MIIRMWTFIKQAVKIIHKAIMCAVRFKELTRPHSRKYEGPFSLHGFLFGY